MNDLNQPIFNRKNLFFSILFFTITSLFSQPVVDCQCPEGGNYSLGSTWPQSIEGELSRKDISFIIDQENWDFGTKDQLPDKGYHYYDYFIINVSIAGEYSFAGSDGNKLLIGVFKNHFLQNNLVLGIGGYVGDTSSLYFEEPKQDGLINNTTSLDTGVYYYIVLTDYDAKYSGAYNLNITVPDGAEIKINNTIHENKCKFYGCYQSDVEYNFPMPVVEDVSDYNITWTQDIFDGPECGSYVVSRKYTIEDSLGNKNTCYSEYYFSGIDLANLTWPINWDGLSNNNPDLSCSQDFPVDENGNPNPLFTGAPYGFDESCGTIEVFYNDNSYNIDCGKKILRKWTLVDDCTGGVFEHTQIIKVSNNWMPGFKDTDEFVIKTKPYQCFADIELDKILNKPQACIFDSKTWISITGGTISGDTNGNGYIDETEKWEILNIPIGSYEMCYFAEDSCESERKECISIRVVDQVPPIAVCEQYKEIKLKSNLETKIIARYFDSGSFDNCNPVYFKVLRVNENLEFDSGCELINGDDDTTTAEIDVWYDDEVFFCCDDIDNKIMVSLRVFEVDPGVGPVDSVRMNENGDLFNRYRDCWSVVKVEYGNTLTLNCPSVTVSCDESIYPEENPNLEVKIENGCVLELGYTDNREDKCGNVIKRKWTVIGLENEKSCEQIITISDSITPIDPCTIVFPKDTIVDCASNLEFENKPTWEGGACHHVTAEMIHEDTFKFVDDVCYKIVREWAVIDQCVYEGSTAEQYLDSLNGYKLDCDRLIEDGYYRYRQTLFVRDTIAPTINVEDQCIATTDCYAYDVELEAKATDICDLTQKFDWTYIITNMDTWQTIQYSYNYIPEPSQGRKGKRSKDLLDKTANGEILILDPLPEGYYKVTWTVLDGCGNTTSKKQFFRIADKTAPTPIMVDIATAVMTNGIVELKARTFDKGGCDYGCLSSVDNCTPKNGLYFTFSDKIPHLWENISEWSEQWSKYGRYYFDPVTGLISTKESYLLGVADAWLPEQGTSQRMYSCDFSFEDDVYFTKTIQVFVFDKFDDSTDNCYDNNFDFENVTVNFNHCSGSGRNFVEGIVKTPNGIPFTGLELKTVGITGGKYTISQNGKYKFELEKGTYEISGTYNKDYLNGISTADIIHIQRYLLGLESFDNPLKRVAMNVSDFGFISAKDILTLSKLLLRKKYEFPNYSWIAISDNYDFGDPFLGYYDEEKARVQYVNLDNTGIKDVNFSVVKIGDVDFSANLFPPIRIDRGLTFEVENKKIVKGDLIEIPFYAKSIKDIWGLQFTMDISGLNIVKIIPGYISIKEGNYNVVENNLLVSYYSYSQSIEDDDLLFTLRVLPSRNTNVKDILKFNDKYLRTEVYYGDDLESDKINLSFKESVSTTDLSSKFKLFQNEPNPFSNKTTIGFNLPHASLYNLTIYDMAGKELVNQAKKGQGKDGYNSITIDINDFPSKGMYIYKLESEKNIAVKKMLIQ